MAQPGVGKTYLMGKKIAKCNRCILINSVGNFCASNPQPRQNVLRGYEYFTDITRFTERLRQVRHGSFRLAFTPVIGFHPNLDDKKLKEHRRKLVSEALMLAWFVKNTVVAIDEVWLYQETTYSPPYLENMMLTGRHHGITLLWTAQRPAKVDATLRGVSSELYLGRMGRLERQAYDGDVPEEALSRLASLPDRQFMHVDAYKNVSLFISK